MATLNKKLCILHQQSPTRVELSSSLKARVEASELRTTGGHKTNSSFTGKGSVETATAGCEEEE
jgi:hypothetical protein